MRIVRTLSLLLLLLALAVPAAAQIVRFTPASLASFYGRVVQEVEYDIPDYMDVNTIKRASKLKKDSTFDRWRVRKTLRNMSLIDEIENVALRVAPVGEKVKVSIKVYPRYILRDIRVVGNLSFNAGEILEDILHIEPGDDFRRELLEVYKGKLRAAYARVGKLKAKIKIDFQLTKRRDDNKADLRIKIYENPTFKIIKFDFDGAALGIYQPEQVLEIARWKTGMDFDQNKIEKGLKRLKKKLRQAGHLEMRIPELGLDDPDSYVINEEESEIVVRFPLIVGPRVDITYEEECFTCTERKWHLEDVLGLENQRRFNKWIAADFTKKIRVYLQRQGYYTAIVEYEYKRYTEENGQVVKHIVLRVDRGPKVKIRSIDFKENPSFKDRKLEDQLTNTKYYVEEDFENDLKNVINYYNSHGFLQAKVVQKAVEFDELENAIDIMVVLDEGIQTRLRQVKLEGNSVISDEELLAELAEADYELTPGRPLNPFLLPKIKAVLLTAYLRKGYAKARVKEEVRLVANDRHADIRYTFTEGRQFFFGDIYYRGNKLTKKYVIRRELVVVPGHPYNFEKIFRSEQALVQLGFFNSVDISPVSDEFDEERIDMMVTVNERKSGYIVSGLGYNTFSGYTGVWELGHRNLAGHGRRLGFRVEAWVADESFVFDQRNTTVYFTWPWMARVPLDGSLTIRDAQLNEIAYDVRTFSLTIGSTQEARKMLNFLEATHPDVGVQEFAGSRDTHEVLEPFTVKLDWEMARDYIYNLDEAVTDQSQGLINITTLSPMVIFDLRDNIFNPTRWTYNSIRFDYGAPYLMSEINYLKVTGRTSWYLPVYEVLPFLPGLVWAENVVVGHGQSLRVTDTIPISRRYFLGGSTTMRGFGQNEISPTGEDGRTPVGGYFIAYANNELRFPLGVASLGMLFFFDAGNVTDGTNTFFLDKLRTSAGLGLRFLSPVGPLSADYGFKLNREPDETVGEFYITIGNAF